MDTHIVGCGRSGTTALGRALARHPGVRYLNEPRAIWRIDPRSDIWRDDDRATLVLGPEDLGAATARRLRTAFTQERRGRHLVEKLPINNFRIGYLAALHPDATFIHLVRDGLDVAASIARRAAEGAWFSGRKWKLLAEHAHERGLAGTVELCTDDGLRGLLEWRLSVEAGRAGLERYAGGRFLEVTYDELVTDPQHTLSEVLRFLGLPPADAVADGIARQSPRVSRRPNDVEARIAGRILERV